MPLGSSIDKYSLVFAFSFLKCYHLDNFMADFIYQ